jgi:hypothetical protein
MKGREAWQILDLAFSCRSAGRGVEQSIVNQIAAMALRENATSLFINFVPGPRNLQMFEILKDCGFLAPNGAIPVEGTSLRLDRSLGPSTNLLFPAWLAVEALRGGFESSSLR